MNKIRVARLSDDDGTIPISEYTAWDVFREIDGHRFVVLDFRRGNELAVGRWEVDIDLAEYEAAAVITIRGIPRVRPLYIVHTRDAINPIK